MPNDGAMMGAAAITGFAVWELGQMYCRMAPELSEIRDTHCDSTAMRQRVLDADMCVGGLALLAGGAASWLSQSWVPIVIVAAAMLWVSYYYRAVLNGPTPHQIDGGK